MKTKSTKKTPKCTCKNTACKASGITVKFTIHAEKGKSVYLAGEFNNWDPTAKKMTYRNGIYSTSIKLTQGMYQYKFVIDGVWCCDPENAESVPNDQGTFNSVLIVK